MAAGNLSLDVFRAVADPTRRKLLDLLRTADRSVNELGKPFRMSQPAISQHLRILRKAGLVRARRSGPRRMYRLNPRPLARVQQWVERYAQVSDPSGHAWRLVGPRQTKVAAPSSQLVPQPNVATILKRFDAPDEVRTFDKGRFELVRIGNMTIGRARYEPGWKWSTNVKPQAGTDSCQVEHIGLVLEGRCMAKMDDGKRIELKPGDLFYIAPGHDSWVVGNQPHVSLHFLGAEAYAV